MFNPISLFFYVFPFILLLAAAMIFQEIRAATPENRFLLYLSLVFVLFTSVMIVIVGVVTKFIVVYN